MEVMIKHEDNSKFNKRLDDLEQREKSSNIIVTGVPKGKDVISKSVELLREKLGVVLSRSDIKYAVRLGEENGNTTPVKIAFKDVETKNRMYKCRTKLKGTSVWMAEDLTPRRSNLAFKAREVVRKGKATQTWTFDGNIFIKTARNGRPQKITEISDLPQTDSETEENASQ
jgi:hypothetical protein